MTPLSAITAAYKLLPESLNTPAATAWLLAAQLQEDPAGLRRQVGGPARGLWQFEEGGGVKGVMRHKATAEIAADVCDARGVAFRPDVVHAKLEFDDVLAAAFARLLLFTETRRLPKLGDVADAWKSYIDVWRPGAYWGGTPQKQVELRRKWGLNYAKAMEEAHDAGLF